MTNGTLKKLLRELHACEAAVEWVGKRDLSAAWLECDRADWMLWLCATMIGKPGWPSGQQLVLAACDCADRALRYVSGGENRPAEALQIVRAWARGEASIEDLSIAAACCASAAESAVACCDAAACCASAAESAAAESAVACCDAAAWCATAAASVSARGAAAAAEAISASCAEAISASCAVAAAEAISASCAAAASAAWCAASAAEAAAWCHSAAYRKKREKELRVMADIVRKTLFIPAQTP